MFSETANDTWESSAFQDAFIKDYFGEKKSPSKEAAVMPRKRSSCTSETFKISSMGDDGCEPKKLKYHEVVTDNLPKQKMKEACSSLVGKTLNKSKKSAKKFLKNASFIDSTILKKTKMAKLKRLNKTSSLEDLSTCLSKSQEIKRYPIKDGAFVSSPSCSKKTLFESKAYEKFQAAKFRYLNELLYTNTGNSAMEYFQQNTDEFQDYHAGYQSQVAKWPLNPVDVIIKDLQRKKNVCVIADLGCGEAKISEAFPSRTVHSFDLIALNENVTPCDMANVPLPGESVDAAVFCLSLMGTNWKEYLLEGHRILKLGGFLKIAEIESRIEDKEEFVRSIEKCGFCLVNKDMSHKMFVFFNFKKVKQTLKASKVKVMTLKPCLYKKR